VTRLLRLAAFACALAVLAVAAGCGGATTASGDAVTFEQLANAASTSADATSGRFSFSFEMTVPEMKEPFAFAGEGALDATTERAQLSFDFSSFAQLLGGLFSGFAGPNPNVPDFGDPSAWKIDAVQDGGVVYIRLPAMSSRLPAGKSWVRTDLDEAARSQGFDFSQLQDLTGGNDPRKLLDLLRAASGEIETVGTENLRGVSTTHYRAMLSLADYEKLVPPEKREELRSTVREMLEQTGVDEIPVDVWLDGSGLVRKLEMSFAVTQPGTTKETEAGLTFELWDYGERVEIDLPPADQVVDQSALSD
jgi:hypothetical protein